MASVRPGRRRQQDRRAASPRQLAWRNVRNRLPPVEILDAGQLEAVHDASMRILEEVGMDFLHPEALAILKAAGADVEPGGNRVRLDRNLVLEHVAKAPSAFSLHARNPDRTLEIGGDSVVFSCVASAPNVADRDRGRRPGNERDFLDLVRLSQTLNCIHLIGGYPVEPIDLAPETRHLDALRAVVTLSDKAFHAYSLGRVRIQDGIEMVRIARGISREQLITEPSVVSIINTSSPLRLDGPMIEGVIELARAGQITCITPFTLAGAMAPATIPGALAQQNAEALAGIAFAQIVSPGAPVIYGGFTSNVDMKSGAPAFGTPEYVKATLAGGQLARRYGLPFRSSSANAANTLDAQSAYESLMSLWAAILSGTHLVKHAAGWMEGGLVASFEKMILDADLLQMMMEILEPLRIDEETLALDAVREVGPGGHFFGAAHTLARYETAFYAPLISDWRNFESWREAGAPTAYDRANRLYKELLATYEPPPLDPAIAEELDAFVARRKEQGGAPRV